MKFEEFRLSDKLKRALNDINYFEATKIQEETIPLILEDKDIIGQSQTGTGKTAAFGVPIVEKINTEIEGTQALILCPTRELAVQIADEIKKYTKYCDGIKTLAVYGGQPIERQITQLKRKTEIVIGTPGRIMDHMRRKTLKLNNVKMVVLDESDEMLNMGFEEDIQTILSAVPEERQTILFSATMNPKILKITKKYLTNPVNIKVEAKELTVENIDQTLIEMKSNMKEENLLKIIDVNQPKKVIIFCNTKRKVDNLIEMFKSKGYMAEGLHGDIKQMQRDKIMKRLKNGEFPILVATDVVARGIDIEDLDIVINFDVPQEEEYYVHRIGRTGRNGHKGKSFTFVVGREKNKIYDIERYANTKIKKGKLPTLEEVEDAKNKEIFDRIQKVIDEESYSNSRLFEKLVNQNGNVEKVAKALFSIVTSDKPKEVNTKKGNFELNEDGNVRLFLNVGKKDKIMVKDIVGSFSANATISGDEIGNIKLLDNFSFVDISPEKVESVLNKMKGKQIKGRNVNIEIAQNKM